VHFWWECAGILHPATPGWLRDTLTGLQKLSWRENSDVGPSDSFIRCST
jgi:hypothetical protein